MPHWVRAESGAQAVGPSPALHSRSSNDILLSIYNRWYKLNSCLYQLVWFCCTSFYLKSQNLWTEISEDLLYYSSSLSPGATDGILPSLIDFLSLILTSTIQGKLLSLNRQPSLTTSSCFWICVFFIPPGSNQDLKYQSQGKISAHQRWKQSESAWKRIRACSNIIWETRNLCLKITSQRFPNPRRLRIPQGDILF